MSLVLRIGRRFGRYGLYFAVPAISALAPLIAVPVISGRFGASGWSPIAIAISIGTTAAAVAELGYGVTGPQDVARRSRHAAELYMEATAAKLLALAVLGPIAVTVTVMLCQTNRLTAGLVAFATAAGSLSPAWFFIGRGRPEHVLGAETLPRVAAVGLSAGLMLIGGPLVVYGLLLLVAAAVTFIASSRLARVDLLPPARAWRAAPHRVKEQGVIVLGRAISTVYTSLPTAIVGIHGQFGAGLYSAADRPMRMGYTILGGVTDKLQSWVGGAGAEDLKRRRRVTIAANVALGLIAGGAYALLGPLVARILFVGRFGVTYELAALAGLCVALMCASRGLGLVVVSMERANALTGAVLVAAVVGALSLPGLTAALGGAGAFVGVACAESAGLLAQIVIIARTSRAEASRQAAVEAARRIPAHRDVGDRRPFARDSAEYLRLDQ